MKPYLLNILHPLVERISKEFTASKVKTEYFLLNLEKLGTQLPKQTVSCPSRQHSQHSLLSETQCHIYFSAYSSFSSAFSSSDYKTLNGGTRRKGCERE